MIVTNVSIALNKIKQLSKMTNSQNETYYSVSVSAPFSSEASQSGFWNHVPCVNCFRIAQDLPTTLSVRNHPFLLF